MILKNGRILTPDGQFRLTDLTVEDGTIRSVGPTDAPGEELHGAYVIPGLIDLHTHGCAGYDHLDGTPEATQAMCRCYASHGTTSVLATVMTQAPDVMEQAVRNAASRMGKTGGAHIRGIYLEGPFFSDRYRGAQHPEYLRDPDPAFFRTLDEASNRTVRIISLAPERADAQDFICTCRARVFLGHTAADYETAHAAYEAGARGLTHTFNAMTPFHHRQPGVIAAALECGAYCECICDGFHVHPAAVRLLHSAVGKERFVMISDSLRPTDLPDGQYDSAGQTVFVKDGKALLESGVIAGSTAFLLDEVRNLVRWGIPLADAVYAATAAPAKAAGIFERVGSIEEGKAADLLILGTDLTLQRVILGAE